MWLRERETEIEQYALCRRCSYTLLILGVFGLRTYSGTVVPRTHNRHARALLSMQVDISKRTSFFF